MAWDDDFDYYVPEKWSEDQAQLYDDMIEGNSAIAADQQLQFLYEEALYDMDLSPMDREIILGMLEDYLWEEYDIVFDEVFDWHAYREWYENV